MTIRAAYATEDIQKCIFKCINAMSGFSSRWTVILGWPNTDAFKKLAKPFIYVLDPVPVNKIFHQGGIPFRFYEMIIGIWDDRKTGGSEEINLMTSNILNNFEDSKTLHSTKFTVTLDSTYTDTTLHLRAISVLGITGPRDIATEDLKEFRKEFTILLKA
jgi:hypothetical protein